MRNHRSRSRLAPIVAFLCLAAPAAAQDEPSFRSSIPVLGRILEKGLESRGVQVGPLQWAYLHGRGVLFLGDIELASLDPVTGARAGSEADTEWENARREIVGEPLSTPDDSVKVDSAVRAVTGALRQFGDRLELPDGEEVRVAFYRNQSSCGSCHRVAATAGDDVVSSFVFEQLSSPLLTPGHAHVSPREALVIDREGIVGGVDPTLREDAAVLARVIDKKVARNFPNEYWNVDMRGRPGAMGLTVGDWGPLVVLNLTFPFAEETASTGGSQAADAWEQARREILGASPGSEDAESRRKLHTWIIAGRSTQPVSRSMFLATVKTALATFAGRIRGLSADSGHEVVVLVFGDRGGAPGTGEEGNVRASWSRAVLRGLNNDVGLGAPGTAQRPPSLIRWSFPAYTLRLGAGEIAATGEDASGLVGKIRIE